MPPVRLTQSSSRRRAVVVALGVTAAISGAMTIAVWVLGLRGADAELMMRLLVISALLGLGAGGTITRSLAGRRWDRLGTRIAAAQIVGVIVALVCVLPTVIVMFSSLHDRNLLLLLLGYSLAIALVFSAVIGGSIASSLTAIRSGAVEMAGGDLSVRVPIAAERELAELGVAFNTMAERLETAFARQQELEEARQGLIAAVSHDLRTPLASLRVMVEAIADGVAADPTTIQRYIGAMKHETLSLSRLIDDLFELARLDAGNVRLNLEPTAIETLIAETLSAMEAQAEQQRVTLRSNLGGGVDPVLVDPGRIERVLYNLIQNAIRHTPADGSVIVEVLDRGPELQVNVRDTGEGIEPSDLPHLFDRFYRGDKARARDETGMTGGAGLGLSIARRLIETHGGQIWVNQLSSGGALFSFTLPKALASQADQSSRPL
jgi:signal transduction histidine kinase